MSTSDLSVLRGTSIIFDLDGTLVHTAPDLVGALNHVLSAEGIAPVRLDEIDALIGQGAKAMIRKAFEFRGVTGDHSAGADRLWPNFIAFYANHIAEESRPYDGVEAALDRLRDAGASLAVCTNKTQALSERLLDALGLQSRFSIIVGADAVPARKPDPGHYLAALGGAGGHLRHVLIGDSQTDAQTAQNAGAPFVFWPHGYGPEPKNGVRVDAVLQEFASLPEVLASTIFEDQSGT